MTSPILRSQSYGKSQVRLSRVHRQGQQHEFIELMVSIELSGDFDAAYAASDNSRIVATDSMKNTVYVLAQQQGVTSIESFAILLAGHFRRAYAHVNQVRIRCQEMPWTRLESHLHAFQGGGSERRTCELSVADDSIVLRSGLTGLTVLKTSGSGFAGFLRDEYTTLPDTEDRIFATSIEASWPCKDPAADWPQARQLVRAALIDVFANQYSKSVQHTLYEMARAAFAACPLIDEIEITMPNQHHIPVNLTPFGLTNANEVFVPTSEPFGRISATLVRPLA